LDTNLARLSVTEIETIKANKMPLIEAQSVTQVPWQMLAAVWYREHALTMGNNPFQFDPLPSHGTILGLLHSYTDYEPLKYSVDDFDFAAILAACWLRSKCRYPLVVVQNFQYPSEKENEFDTVQVITVNKEDEAVADAFYGYNGRAYGDNPFNSPYVANELDELHHNMSFRGTVDGKWVDIVDQRPGAFVVYKQLIQENV
jgi:lysozyme family protein